MEKNSAITMPYAGFPAIGGRGGGGGSHLFYAIIAHRILRALPGSA
jgi:hypothetical protein